jgi:hypothetical protein
VASMAWLGCGGAGGFPPEEEIRPDVTRHLEERPRRDLGWGQDDSPAAAMASRSDQEGSR